MPETQTVSGMNILLWRAWKPQFNYPATFSSLEEHSVGGTDTQLLWHARILRDMGNQVQVLGATSSDVWEEGIEFLGAASREEQDALIGTGRVRKPNIIFMEGAFAAAEFFKSRFPTCKVVHVGQNIDRNGDRAALQLEPFIDVYGFVGIGQLANYCVKYPSLRHKFLLLRNIVPWDWSTRKLPRKPVTDQIAWVGAWSKKGLRQWAEIMEGILQKYPSYSWRLYGPLHGSQNKGFPDYIFNGLNMPSERIRIESLPIAQLMQEISSARLVLVSLGNECGPISILDVHAMGRPALSGNDMVYKYSNPEGTGVRVTTSKEGSEAISHLLDNAELCEKLGAYGRKLIEAEYTEKNQQSDIQNIIEYLQIQDDLKSLADYHAPSARAEDLSEIKDKVARKRLKVLGR